MKFIQKLLSHGLLIALGVAAALLYVYRAQLFPQWFGAGANSAGKSAVVASAPAAPEAVAPEAAPPPAPPVPEPAARAEPGLPPLETADTAPAPSDSGDALPPLAAEAGTAAAEPPAAAEPAQPSQQASAQEAGLPPAEAPAATEAPAAEAPAAEAPAAEAPAAEAPAAEAPAAEAPAAEAPAAEAPAAEAPAAEAPAAEASAAEASAGTPAPAVMPQQSRQQAPASAPTGAATADTPAADASVAAKAATAPADDAAFREQLGEARALFWQRDTTAAEQAYRALVQHWPQQAGAWGELGNLYFNQGRWSEAADAYAHTVELLLTQGEQRRARYLLGVLRGLDPARAGELEQRLDSAGG